jgi:hypothetical protein
VLGGGLAAPVLARAEPTPLRLELNRLEAREDGACRVWLVAGNPASEAIDPLRIDLVLFGRDAVVLRRIAVDIGPLPASRTAVRIFDLAGQACEGIGHFLLNDVLACGGTEPARRAACTDRLTLSSRAAGVEFHK